MRNLWLTSCLIALTTTVATSSIANARDKGPHSAGLSGATVAVLPFEPAPGQPETGPAAQRLAAKMLAKEDGARVLEETPVVTYLRDHRMPSAETDREALDAMVRDLNVDLVVWGTVNQFTSYKSDKPGSETPPFVQLTVYAARPGQPVTTYASAQRSTNVPPTVFSSAPSFEKLAAPLMKEAIQKIR